jgi:alkylation response protein AidB-like acyl-CoA dehydrogenase
LDFTLSPDQELVRDSARALLANECPPAVVRAHIDDPSAADSLWKHLREWAGLAGAPLVDLCLLMEEMGAVLAPGPLLPTTALFGPVLQSVGNDLLAAVLAGDATGTVAVAGASGEWVPNHEPVKTFVLEADRVDHLAVVLPGPAVAVMPAGGLPTRPVDTIDPSRRVFEVEVPQALEPQPWDDDGLRSVLERAWVALAAETLGAARWCFEAALAYAKERVQFDRPIGSFQAIQHKTADMGLALERAWSAVYYAAMALDAGDPDRHRAAHVAKAAAGQAARLCAKESIQIHGGIGFTWEHDLHLYIRRIYASEALLGTTGWHHDRLADLLLGSPEA